GVADLGRGVELVRGAPVGLDDREVAVAALRRPGVARDVDLVGLARLGVLEGRERVAALGVGDRDRPARRVDRRDRRDEPLVARLARRAVLRARADRDVRGGVRRERVERGEALAGRRLLLGRLGRRRGGRRRGRRARLLGRALRRLLAR